jgi:hypothetical protein
MKSTAKQLTTYGNLGLVQLRLEPETAFFFRPGGPEIVAGGLIVSESTGEGVVGKLITINNTEAYLLLTDADVLVGAKQNRVMNKSMLLAPLAKTVIDVSCIERLRWQYTSQSFSNPGTVADPDLRKEKARSLSCRIDGPEDQKYETQRTVWSHIHASMNEQGCASRTESYSDLINYRMERGGNDFPACEPESGCNGIAVILNRKIISVDLFGREEVFIHYFPMLRDSAFRMAGRGKKDKPLDQHEAYYRVLEAIDESEAANRIPDDTYSGAGLYNTIESESFVGSSLTFNGELIHNAFFAKQS